MTESFELFHEADKLFGFRLKDPDEAVLAVSVLFPDKASAVEGIGAVRECAGMGLITDLCPADPVFASVRATVPSRPSAPKPGVLFVGTGGPVPDSAGTGNKGIAMSMKLPSFPASSNNRSPVDLALGMPSRNSGPGLIGQDSGIIDVVLPGLRPERSHLPDQRREQPAAQHGQAGTAPSEHTIALKSLAGLPVSTDKEPRPTPWSTVRLLAESSTPSALRRVSRIEELLEGRMLLTAFQPIYELSTCSTVGVEAFTRFVSDGSDTADYWFAEAVEAKLGRELEFAALEFALASAQHLPPHLYVALKLSPATCLDPLLPGLLEESMLAPERMVLELTQSLTEQQAAALILALVPLRQRGIRLAIDHAGSYFDSIRHIRGLQADIIKLDRGVIAGIDTDTLRHAFGEAMVGFAEQLGAALVAEGIETAEELAAVAALGVSAVQGYFLGRLTARPQDWTQWSPAAPSQSIPNTPAIPSIWY
ncbi:EAL domain-containing protein [Arthrobacter cheniae]|nr:EAL domain-containing protein [Arthrobacter cheniae]